MSAAAEGTCTHSRISSVEWFRLRLSVTSPPPAIVLAGPAVVPGPIVVPAPTPPIVLANVTPDAVGNAPHTTIPRA